MLDKYLTVTVETIVSTMIVCLLLLRFADLLMDPPRSIS